MEEETQSPEIETPQSLGGNEYPSEEIQQMEQPEISNGSKKPSTLLLVGFFVVLALIITVITSYSIHYTKLYDLTPGYDRVFFNQV